MLLKAQLNYKNIFKIIQYSVNFPAISLIISNKIFSIHM